MRIRAALLTTTMILTTSFAFANTAITPANNQTLEIGGTKINFTINKGTQVAPSLGVAYKDDVKFVHAVPDVYWEANDQNKISGKTNNNIHNATIDQFLKSTGNQASFRILVDDGSGAGLNPAVVMSNHQPLLAPAFDLSSGKTKNCSVSYITDAYGGGYWTANCSTK